MDQIGGYSINDGDGGHTTPTSPGDSFDDGDGVGFVVSDSTDLWDDEDWELISDLRMAELEAEERIKREILEKKQFDRDIGKRMLKDGLTGGVVQGGKAFYFSPPDPWEKTAWTLGGFISGFFGGLMTSGLKEATGLSETEHNFKEEIIDHYRDNGWRGYNPIANAP